jgi:hypothetical protein
MQLSAKIAQVDQRAADAKVERENRMADGPDPEPWVRTLRRLRHDIDILGRALSAPLPQTAPERLRMALRILLAALSGGLAASAEALASGEETPSLDGVKAAVGEYRASLGAGEPFFSIEKNEDFQRTFTLLFMAEQALRNAQDLADRATELAAAGRS